MRTAGTWGDWILDKATSIIACQQRGAAPHVGPLRRLCHVLLFACGPGVDAATAPHRPTRKVPPVGVQALVRDGRLSMMAVTS